MVKKLTAIILSCCLFLNIVGHYLVYELGLARIKAEMKASLSYHQYKEIDEFSFLLSPSNAVSGLHWEDENEFTYGGNRYDVIDKKLSGNYLIIRCVNDKKETDLIKAYTTWNKENEPSSKQKSASRVNIADSYYEPVYPYSLFPYYNITTPLQSRYSKALLSHSTKVITPPPQVS